MPSLLQLRLEVDKEKAEAPDTSKPEVREPQPPVMGKRLNAIVNRAAHKAATHSGRQGSGIFSK